MVSLSAGQAASKSASEQRAVVNSRKRHGVDELSPGEKGTIHTKKRVKFAESSDTSRARGHLTPPPRRSAAPQHIGISPIKFGLGASEQGREVYYDLTDERGRENGEASLSLDTSQLHSMWQKLHEGDRSSADVDASAGLQDSAKSSISLSKLLTLQHRRSSLLPSTPSPLTPSSNVSPTNHSEPVSPYSDVQLMLRKLSSLADSKKEASGTQEADDSMCDNDEDEEEPMIQPFSSSILSEAAIQPQVAKTISHSSIAPAPQLMPQRSSAPPTQVPKASISSNHHVLSHQPPVQSTNPIITRTIPPRPVPSTASLAPVPKRAIFGTRLTKPVSGPANPAVALPASKLPSPQKLATAHPQPINSPSKPLNSPQKLSSQVSSSPSASQGSPKLNRRSVTVGPSTASAFLASSQSQSSPGLVKTLSEPKLSQGAPTSKKSVAEVLDWLDDAGFSYEDFVSVDTNSHPTHGLASNVTAAPTHEATAAPSLHFFEEEGESSSTASSQGSRPTTSNTPEIVDGGTANVSFSEFTFDEDALEAQMAEIEQLRALKPDDEEDEETALTTSRYRRFLVLEVSEGEVQDTRLRAIDSASNSEHFISLRDEWSKLDVQIGDIINVVGRIEPQGSAYTYIVDHQRNLVILHPDVLVFGTMLAQGADCERRAIINYCAKTPARVDIAPEPDIENLVLPKSNHPGPPSANGASAMGSSDTNHSEDNVSKEKPIDPRLALYGIFVHELFQFATDNLDFTSPSLNAYVDVLIQQRLIDIFASGDTEEKVRGVLRGWIPSIVNWAQRFFPSALTDSNAKPNKTSFREPSASRFRTDNNDGTIEIGDKKYTLRVIKTLDVEEHVVSIMYGLKGDIDVTFVIELQPVVPKFPPPRASTLRGPKSPQRGDPSAEYGSTKTLLIPLEVKSGSLNTSFVLQVLIYALLLADRYHRDIPLALLFSIKENNMVALEVTRRQVLFAIEKRNVIASYLHRRYRLPPVLRTPGTCIGCYQADACMTLHRAFEHGTAKSAGIDETNFAKFSSGISDIKHGQFLSNWFSLIDLEQAEVERYRQQNWTLPKKEREKLGRTISGLRLVAVAHSRPEQHTTAHMSQKSTQAGTQSQRLGSQHAKQTVATGKRLLYLTFERWPAQIHSEDGQANASTTSLPEDTHQPRKTKNPPDDAALLFSPDISQSSRKMKLTDLHFSVGDLVILSEGRHFSVTTCTVVEVNAHSLVVSCNRPSLRLPPRELSVMLPTSQRWTPLQSKMKQEKYSIDLEALGATCMPSQSQDFLHGDFENKDLAKIRYRVDREEQQTGFNALKGNILQLFRNTHWARKFRGLFVDLCAPRFGDESVTTAELEKLKALSFSLNSDQILAVNKVLSAKDYALILGMPGTGKTTTVAVLVALLVWRGKTVLLSAATHSAVDGLLLQLLRLDVKFLRLGHPDLVNPAVRHAALLALEDVSSVARLNELVGPGSPRYAVVAATCLGVNHLLLQSRSFDYCIVDETSQATFPTILGPMRLASIGVFIGDLYQLPPIVRSPQAVAAGMQEETIFKMLAAAHPSAVSKLRTQYRMNEAIMKLSNHLIYQGLLRCGSESVANRKFEFSDVDYSVIRSLLDVTKQAAFADPLARTKTWVEEILDHNRQVIFVNTDFVPAPEDKVELADVVRNPIEATIVAILAKTLLHIGVDRQALGIISPLKAQLKQIHLALASILNPSAPLHSKTLFNNVHTVDKYQGADIDCVIVSFVRSNVSRNVGTLLKDWRRINVAFTRAKKKLIIIGSRSTLSSNHLLSAFFELVDQNGFMFNLPPNATSAYTG